MTIIIASDNLSNTAIILASGKGQVETGTSILKDLGAPEDKQYWNNAFIVNNHTATIKVGIGKDTQLISAGDAYSWDVDNEVLFTTIFIEEMGTLAQIDIGDVIVQVKRTERN